MLVRSAIVDSWLQYELHCQQGEYLTILNIIANFRQHLPVNSEDGPVLVALAVQPRPVREHVLDTLGLLVADTHPRPALHLQQARVQDKPLLVEGEAQLHRCIVSHHVVPLVHVHR